MRRRALIGSSTVVEEKDYLCFTAEQANSTVRMIVIGTPTGTVELETSSDKVNWTPFVIGTTTITLANVGDKVYFRGDNETMSEGSSKYRRFVMTGKIAASGNVMSLLDKSCESKEITVYSCFYTLFSNCASLTTAPELPATTLNYNCYGSMFSACTSLTTAPELPATTLATSCYSSMFNGCTSLTTAPELPATTLAKYCYMAMLYGCSSLKISATQTGEYQYPWRIPTSGAGTSGNGWNTNMLANTGGTFTGNPSINTTYYTTNPPV